MLHEQTLCGFNFEVVVVGLIGINVDSKWFALCFLCWKLKWKTKDFLCLNDNFFLITSFFLRRFPMNRQYKCVIWGDLRLCFTFWNFKLINNFFSCFKNKCTFFAFPLFLWCNRIFLRLRLEPPYHINTR